MSDDEAQSEAYSSEAGDFGEEDVEVDLDEEGDGGEHEPDQDQDQELVEIDGVEESDSEDGDSDEDEDDEDDDEDEDAEGDADDDGEDNQADIELEAGLVAMEESVPTPGEENKASQETPVTVARPLTPAQIRRGLFTTNPPYPKSWIIEPMCALPHPVATHALAASTCLSYLITGSDDGFLRCYDLFASVNGKTYLTAPQRHHCGVGEGAMKAGIIKTWWENYVPAPPTAGAADGEDKVLSSVHSLVMQGDGLWGLSGSASGHLNLFTMRHDPGRIHHTFNAHKGAVSGLALSSDEMFAFSAGWDAHAKQWDLNTGQMVRTYDSHGAQLVAVALRPMTPATVVSDGRLHPPNLNEPHGKEENDSGSSNGSDDDDSLFGDDSGEEGDRYMVQAKRKRSATGNRSNKMKSATNFSADVVMVAYIDGQVKLWDRRSPSVSSNLGMSEKCPPWCVSACWSANGNEIYAGRRNGAIDVWDIRQHSGSSTQGGPKLVKTLRNPASSGPVSCVAAFPDGQHVVCASQDNVRLWKVADETHADHKRSMPFKIIAGHHGGIVSQILVDPSSRFMITASGNRGWFNGESSKTVLIHDMKGMV